MKRLTLALKAVIRAIDQIAEEGEDIYGYEILQRADVQSGGLYPIMTKLVASGYLSWEWDDHTTPRRKVYLRTDRWPELIQRITR